MRALVLALVLAACGTRTEVILGIATDLDVPHTIDEIHLTVTEDGETLVDERYSLGGAPGRLTNLPASYALYTSGREPDLLVELTGLKGGAEVLTRHAELRLVEGRTSFYRLGLTKFCVDKVDCGDRQSCVEGACVERELDARRFPDYSAELVDTVTCTSGFTTYMDTATKVPLPMAAGAEACPIERCFEGTCLAELRTDGGRRTVSGTAIVTYVSSGGIAKRGIDLFGVAPVAHIREPDGTYSSYVGGGTADGRFEILGVPAGPYLLQLGQSYESMTSNFVDLGYVTLGDPDLAISGNRPITYTLGTPYNWSAGSSIQAFAEDANMFWFGEATGAAPGDNFVKGTLETADAVPAPQHDVDGKLLTWVHLSSQTLDGLPYAAAVAKYEAPATSNVDTVLVPITPQQAFQPSIDMLAWKKALAYDNGYATALHPAALADPGVAIELGGAAAGPQYGLLGPTPTYLATSIPFTMPSGMLPNFTYGVPTFGGRWATLVSTSVHAAVTVIAKGTTVPATVFARLRSDELLLESAGAITPHLGPVRAPAIGGKNLFAQQDGVGETPRIDWLAPELGRPNNYVVGVLRVGKDPEDPTKTHVSLVATISTPETHLDFPPRILVPGNEYMLTIIAAYVASPATPNRFRFPALQSSIVTALFTP